MPRQYISLQECLFSVFVNSAYNDAQEYRRLWAIHEGLRRIEHAYGEWRNVKARKQHKCMRGCPINEGDIYFHHAIGVGWGDVWKFCAGCMAMILYFKEVDQLPPVHSTHWDVAQEKPVWVEE